MRIARERGATVLALTNIMGSQATRDADGVLYTRAGLEVCVAATKTFTCQVGGHVSCSASLAELRGRSTRAASRDHCRPQAHPALHRGALGSVDAQVQEIAEAH